MAQGDFTPAPYWLPTTANERLAARVATVLNGATILTQEIVASVIGYQQPTSYSLPTVAIGTYPVPQASPLAARFAVGQKTTRATGFALSGDSSLITPAAGERVRLHWFAMSTSEGNSAEVKVQAKFGAAVIYSWNMGTPGAFSHWETVEGAADQALTVNLSASQPVEFNYTFQSVA